MLGTILWIIIAIVLVAWLLGLVFSIGGNLIWILLVIAAIILIVNLLACPGQGISRSGSDEGTCCSGRCSRYWRCE